MKAIGFKSALLWIAIISIMAYMTPTTSPQLASTQPSSPKTLLPHDPIYIDGNAAFTPANGVISGSGTAHDPYIIGRWDINAENANGIEIRNTTAHFIVRNCYVHDGRDNGKYGIYFYGVRNGKIDGVTSVNNYTGIRISYSSNNTITKCTIKKSGEDGILLVQSSNNFIVNSTSMNNDEEGIYLVYSSTNNTVENCVTKGNKDGIRLYYSPNNFFANCTFENNDYGIYFSHSNNNTVEKCIAENNRYGVYLNYSDNNTVENCITRNNSFAGVHLWYSNDSEIMNCTTENNYIGIALYNSGRNLIEGCTVSNNSGKGIYIDVYSDNNIITDCTIKNNDTGIHILFDSDNNRIFHNNFLNNANQALDECFNYWDNGYPSGGNRWSDYRGSDSDNDGIGDVPYNIAKGTNQDRYPLMNLIVETPPGPEWELVIGIILAAMIITGIVIALCMGKMRLKRLIHF
jgi:parallel beta-helix repeat protein